MDKTKNLFILMLAVGAMVAYLAYDKYKANKALQS